MRAILKRMINHVSKSDELSVAELRFVIAREDEIFSASDIFIIGNCLGAELRVEIKLVVQNEIVIALF